MEGSGQFLLLDDALRVKGRCTKRLREHPGAGEHWEHGPKAWVQKNLLKIFKEFFPDLFTFSEWVYE